MGNNTAKQAFSQDYLTAEQIAATLGRYTRKPGGGFMACCPAHDDHNPSLAIDDRPGGILVKCFAGCSQDDVISALKSRGLWTETTHTNPLPVKRKPLTEQIWKPVLPIPDNNPPEKHYQHSKPTGTWRYLSVTGELLQIVCRFDPPGQKKEVLPLTYWSNGKTEEWRWKALPAPRPLYGLDRLAGLPTAPVLVVEGEKAADAAQRLLGDRYAVITWSGGSSAPHLTDWQPLTGRQVTIWPDADGPGRKAARTIVDQLAKIQVQARIIGPPDGVPEGWDLADAENDGWTAPKVIELIEAANYEKAGLLMEPQIKIVGLGEFLSMKIAPREEILSPIIMTQGLSMIHAYRGIGKTHVGLGISYAVVSAGAFLKWAAPTPRRVLYLDGEMPASVIQERLAQITTNAEKEPPDPDFLTIMTPDLQPHGVLDLSTAEGQNLLEPYLENIDLIVVDNVSSLCRTGRENEAEGWLPVQGWALRQRSAGRSVLFIHHSGKGGGQRGTSKREDLLDVVLSLKHPSDYEMEQGARFEVHLEKGRHIMGDAAKPFEAWLREDETGGTAWTFKDVSEATADRVVVLFKEGLSQVDIATELGVNKSTVCRSIRKAKAEGRLEK